MNGITSIPVQPPLSDGFSADSLAARLKSGDPGAITKVAKDFESMFVSIVLKEMRQTLGSGSLFGDDSADINGGLFDMFMGKHIVDAGGFGVAKMMEKHLSAG
jgi:peptidoglycan hydrolase FlgJ